MLDMRNIIAVLIAHFDLPKSDDQLSIHNAVDGSSRRL